MNEISIFQLTLQNNQKDLFKKLLYYIEDPFFRDPRGQTILHMLFRSQQSDLLPFTIIYFKGLLRNKYYTKIFLKEKEKLPNLSKCQFIPPEKLINDSSFQQNMVVTEEIKWILRLPQDESEESVRKKLLHSIKTDPVIAEKYNKFIQKNWIQYNLSLLGKRFNEITSSKNSNQFDKLIQISKEEKQISDKVKIKVARKLNSLLNMTDIKGKTIYSIAQKKGNQKMLQILEFLMN